MIRKVKMADIEPGMIVNKWDYNWEVVKNEKLDVVRPVPGQQAGTSGGVLTVKPVDGPHGRHKIVYGSDDTITVSNAPAPDAKQKPVITGPDM